MDIKKRKIWCIVERKNFSKDSASWEEHLIKANVDHYEAEQYINSTKNKKRVLFAYARHPISGTMDMMWNLRYVDSEKTVKKYAKLK